MKLSLVRMVCQQLGPRPVCNSQSHLFTRLSSVVGLIHLSAHPSPHRLKTH